VDPTTTNPVFTPVDYDPFKDLVNYDSNQQTPAMVHTTPESGMPYSNIEMAKDPSQPIPARLAAATAGAVGNIASGTVDAATWPLRFLQDPVSSDPTAPIRPEDMEGAMNFSGLLASPSLGGLPDPDKLGIFAGANAKTADLDALQTAKNMAANGEDPRHVYMSTGWFQGYGDNIWRFEIPDNTAQLTNRATTQLNTTGAASGSLGRLFSHPEAYEAYPELKYIKSDLEYNPFVEGDKGLYSFTGFRSVPNLYAKTGDAELGPAALKPVILHEMMHGIQDLEGFDRGGSPELFQLGAKEAGVPITDDEAYAAYHALSGEVEARNVESRMNMTPASRAVIPPWMTEDVRRKNQIRLVPSDDEPDFGGQPPVANPAGLPETDPFAWESTPPPDQATAFKSLADQQRGIPEQKMLNVQAANGGGVLSPLVEHVGDLTNRMTNNGAKDNYGYDYMDEKVNRALSYLNNPYGFEKEHAENLASNANFRGMTTKDLQNKVDFSLADYANAHQNLPVYNKPQQLARDSAVAIGNKDFDTARSNLSQLKDMLSSPTEWSKAAGQYDPFYESKSALTPVDHDPFANEPAQQ
jgi:hypothetical protein